MAEKKQAVKIRETKAKTFNVLKLAAPTLFGSKLYTDVKYFGQDPNDTSKILIEFNEE